MIYAAAGTLVFGAAADVVIQREPTPWLLALGLGLAWSAAAVLPVALGTTGIWRGRQTMTLPVLIACAASLPPGYALLVVTVAALASGVHIRRFRTTPGRMAMGASRSVIEAAACITVWNALPTDSPVEVVAAAWVAAVIVRWADMPGWISVTAVSLGAPMSFVLGSKWRSAHFWVWRFTYVAIGAIAVLLYRLSPWALALLGPPFGMALAAGSHNARLARQRTRQAGILKLTGQLHRCTTQDEVLDVARAAASEMLGAQVDIAARPTGSSRLEISTAIPWGPEDRWFVARERFGPPLMEGEYGRDEVALLEQIAASVASPCEVVAATGELQRQASIDDLTGLRNRRAGREALDELMTASESCPEPFVMLFVDIDHFKHLNSEFGHDLADEVLCAVGTRLEQSARATDLVARWGGEEFLVVLEDRSDAFAAAEGIRQRVSGPVALSDGRTALVSVSIGAATFPVDGAEISELLHSTSVAMLQAKAAGRNQVGVPSAFDRPAARS